ncbi:unnamed protein product [Lepidochelys kempii]
MLVASCDSTKPCSVQSLSAASSLPSSTFCIRPTGTRTCPAREILIERGIQDSCWRDKAAMQVAGCNQGHSCTHTETIFHLRGGCISVKIKDTPKEAYRILV